MTRGSRTRGEAGKLQRNSDLDDCDRLSRANLVLLTTWQVPVAPRSGLWLRPNILDWRRPSFPRTRAGESLYRAARDWRGLPPHRDRASAIQASSESAPRT